MNTQSSGMFEALATWAISGLAAVLVGALLWVFGGWGGMQLLFVVALAFVVLGVLLSVLMQGATMPPAHHQTSPAQHSAPMPEPVAPAAPAADTAPVAPAVEQAGPARLAAPRDGAPDDLKTIKGIGPKLEKLCHSMGFYHFDQIAAWTEAEVAWVDDNLEGFKGRVTRDSWVAQAKILASGGDADLSKLEKAGDGNEA